MRQIFRENLMGYNRLAKNEPEDQEALEAVLGWHLDVGMAELKTDRPTQERIYELQQQKQAVMAELKDAIAALDDPEGGREAQEDERRITYDAGQYFWHKGKDKKRITAGEIMTDGEWNDELRGIAIKYHLDGSVDRNVRKRYLIEEAKRELRGHLDQQIIANESASGLVDRQKSLTYKKIEQDHESGKDRRLSGLLAEKMVKNFLKKISLDLGGDFEVVEADVYQDVAKKIDFIIRRRKAGRGVKVAENKESVGIQFTINPGKKSHKEEQVNYSKAHLLPEDMVDDIVLVTLPLENVQAKYNEWDKTRFAGGPDKLWSPREKAEIFRGIMKDFLSPQEVEEYCSKFN